MGHVWAPKGYIPQCTRADCKQHHSINPGPGHKGEAALPALHPCTLLLFNLLPIPSTAVAQQLVSPPTPCFVACAHSHAHACAGNTHAVVPCSTMPVCLAFHFVSTFWWTGRSLSLL